MKNQVILILICRHADISVMTIIVKMIDKFCHYYFSQVSQISYLIDNKKII